MGCGVPQEGGRQEGGSTYCVCTGGGGVSSPGPSQQPSPSTVLAPLFLFPGWKHKSQHKVISPNSNTNPHICVKLSYFTFFLKYYFLHFYHC